MSGEGWGQVKERVSSVLDCRVTAGVIVKKTTITVHDHVRDCMMMPIS